MNVHNKTLLFSKFEYIRYCLCCVTLTCRMLVVKQEQCTFKGPLYFNCLVTALLNLIFMCTVL